MAQPTHLATSDQWKNLIRQTQTIELTRKKHPKGLIKFTPNMILYECLDTLSSHNILSAPVVDNAERFLGSIDVLDIAAYILHILRTSSPPLDLNSFEKLTQKFYQTPIQNLLSKHNQPPFISDSCSLQQAITLFRLSQHFKPHRIALVDDKNRLTDIVTQFDIISFAYSNKEALGPMLFKTVEELQISRACVMVRSDISFSDALGILLNNNVSGLALVDESGILVANFSASDLRGIRASVFANCSWTVLDFLNKGTERKHKTVFTCNFNTSLDEVLSILVSNHIHRLYVVSDRKQPLGIISLYDILSLF